MSKISTVEKRYPNGQAISIIMLLISCVEIIYYWLKYLVGTLQLTITVQYHPYEVAMVARASDYIA
jgi:hypothetical protein